jgi:hemerythrin-like domain-containing protein
MIPQVTGRRKFLKTGGLLFTLTASSVFSSKIASEIIHETAMKMEIKEVQPAEDLMREHGVLRRILLIYEYILEKIKAGQSFPVDALNNSAKIIRDFVENYHEKNEENYLFTRFQKEGKETDLVKTLKVQHDKGRILTEYIISNSGTMPAKDKLTELNHRMTAFIKMYRPHASREYTILFPAFKKIISQKEYDSLGDEFEKKEQNMFGEDGFEMMLDKVITIEKKLGIYELAQFTPGV